MTFSELIQREQEWEVEQRALLEAVFDCGDYWGAAIGALDLGLSEELPPRLCRRCSVQDECFRAVLRDRKLTGTWGALTAQERAQYRKVIRG